jgi:hypothetical protein
VAPMKGFVNACRLSFKDSSAIFDLIQLKKTKAGIIGAYKGLETSLDFLAIDL